MKTRPGEDRLAAMLLGVVVAAGGCGQPSSVTAPPSGSALPAIVSSPAAGTAGTPASSGTAPATGSIGPGLTVDAGLLRVLPAQVDGVALEPDPTTAAQIAEDPTLARAAQGIAVALAIRPGTSAGDDLAIASVIRLRPGVFSEAWFEEWRKTYDESACEVAGGVSGAASQVSIAGRTVYVAGCTGDAQTYHVHMADPGLIVSITAAGAGRFGELVVAGLAE